MPTSSFADYQKKKKIGYVDAVFSRKKNWFARMSNAIISYLFLLYGWNNKFCTKNQNAKTCIWDLNTQKSLLNTKRTSVFRGVWLTHQIE